MIPINMFRPTPESTLQRPFNLGRVFYVDNGATHTSDSNEGTDPNHPLTKVQAGIDKCTDDQGDYVFVLDCYNSDSVPIEVNSGCAHIIGMSLPANWGWTVLAGTSDDVFEVSTHYNEIAGFSMIGASKIGVDLQSCSFFWIHHCNFAVGAGAIAYGIRATTGTPSEGLIEECNFGKLLTSITTNGIDGALTSVNIRRNTFRQIAGDCISINIANVGCIYENYFANVIADTPSDGWAIQLGSGCTNGLIMNNYASTTGNKTGNNPYKDSSTANVATLTNAWAYNHAGTDDNPLDPATA